MYSYKRLLEAIISDLRIRRIELSICRGADQLHKYCEADLCLSFCVDKKQVYLRRRSNAKDICQTFLYIVNKLYLFSKI